MSLNKQKRTFTRLYEKANDKKAKEDDMVIIVSNHGKDDYPISETGNNIFEDLLELGLLEKIKDNDLIDEKDAIAYRITDYPDLLYTLLEYLQDLEREMIKSELISMLEKELKS
jgi:hypothetical protein